MGKRAQQKRRRTTAERIDHQRNRAAVVAEHRAKFPDETGSFARGVIIGTFRRA